MTTYEAEIASVQQGDDEIDALKREDIADDARWNADVDRAIAALGAVEVAPSVYAYQPIPPHDRWFIVTANDLAKLDATKETDIDDEGREFDVYERWCKDTPDIQMPAWWSPDKQYAVRDVNSGRIVLDGVLRGTPLAYQGVTVNLETGELIAANLKDVPREQFVHDEVSE